MILFQRMEIKYLIDRPTRTPLTRDLQAFMRPDAHTDKHGSYLVRSLYFDTLDFRAYHDKMAGAAERHKLRVRVYPDSATFVRFEVKSRYTAFIHKITVDLPISEFESVKPVIFEHALPPPHLMQNKSVSKEFFRLQKQLNMFPKIMVQYRREAYERSEINRVRVNFDDELMASRHFELLGPLSAGRRLQNYNRTIFEIKVDGTMPFWLHTLIGKYNLQNQAISKYCYAVRSEARFSATSRPSE
jgi:SPX domain protein involved in polyphosphate accumulation